MNILLGRLRVAGLLLRLRAKKITRFYRFAPLSIAIIIIFVIVFLAIKNLTRQSQSVSGSENKKSENQKSQKSQVLNREFLFPLKDDYGREISKLKYTIQNVELRNEIIIKGQKATAVAGRTFFIVNLKLTNDYNKSVQINSRDYVRLTVNKSSEKLAPDIHNDPVEIQAISTKYTRLALPINTTDTNLTLQVGEIDGKKELIKLNLK